MILKRKKVLLIDLGAFMGGVEVYLEALAEILAPQSDLYAICVLPELAARLRLRGVRVTVIPPFRRFRPLRFIMALAVAPALVLRHGIDVVQINGFLESVLMPFMRLLGCKTVYTRHGPFETDLFKWYQQPLKLLPRFIARHMASTATMLVCVSEAVGDECRVHFAENRIRVIPNWISQLPIRTDRFQRKTQRLEVIYVGRLEHYKGLHLLLEAMQGCTNVRLTVVGDGSLQQSLRDQARGLDVEFVGFQRDTREFYERADLFVMPSMGPEGLPMVTIEAMSYGLPCLFSDLPVHREITDRGHAALLFRNGDVADLREKLLSLLENAADRKRLSENAYRIVEERYHATGASRAYLELFA